jgi:hypothetical protein
VSALEGDREAVMETLGDTIRALDAPDQWRILAAVLNALNRDESPVYLPSESVRGGDYEVRWIHTAHQWRFMDWS